MISFYTQLGPYFKASQFEVYNCSPGSDLTIFPYVDLAEAVKKEIADIPDPETEESYNMYIPDR